MRYWWVSHARTFRQALSGNFLWSPKIKANGNRSRSYDFMTEVRVGDVVFSYGGSTINAIGIVTGMAKSAPRPVWDSEGAEHATDGWLLPVRFAELASRIRPKDHLARLTPFLPIKYSPIQRNGNANQGIYLSKISAEFASVLIELMGSQYLDALSLLQEVVVGPFQTDENAGSEVASPSIPAAYVFPHKPKKGKFHILTGLNGTGKTRYLEKLSANVLDELNDQGAPFTKMLCLSGTIYDKFPVPRKNVEDRYMYFGNKTNNNMFSEIAPFRQLPIHILNKTPERLGRYVHAGEIMKSIGFEPMIILKFKRNNETVDDDNLSEVDLKLLLDDVKAAHYDDHKYWRDVLEKFGFNGLRFTKGDDVLDLEELSSGERLYILTILVLCFCSIDSCLVLFDEPENSLHPKWQAKLMRDMYSMVSKLTRGTTVVVATHSPLVVSSAPNTDSLIRDLPSSEDWLRSDLFGRNSDSVLESQFGLMSPRSMIVTSAIQECLRALVTINFDPDRFSQSADLLASLKIDFEPTDPLFVTVEEISRIRASMP